MRARLVTAVAATLMVALVSSCGSSRQSASLDTLTEDLVAELSGKYEVARGYPDLYTEADCQYTYAALRNCLGNNPAAPYILPIVPTWPNEYSDPALKNAFGKTDKGDSATYRFDPREAIVVFGMLPPPGRYMGLETYLATREGTFDESSPTYQFIAESFPSTLGTFFATVAQNPSRVESFSDLGNSINDVVVEGQSGASFGTLRFFIITPDAGMDDAVRSALGTLGIGNADIFTEQISSTDLRLGLDASADDFITAMRYALPDDADAGDEWRKTLPLSVLRVRERPASTRAPQPYPATGYEPRSATPEDEYSGDLANLLDAVCARWAGCSDQKALPDMEAPPFNLVGPDCRPIGMNCLATTQDSSYYFSLDLTLDSGEIYAVVDALATRTGNATYVSIGVNLSSKLLGVTSIDDPTLEGSAGPYASTVDDSGKFFVYYFTRDCSGLETLTDGSCLSITDDMVPRGDSFKLSLRDYVRPGSARGPDSAGMLKPTVMKVTRP